MSIQPTNEQFIIRLIANYTADTIAELDANLATYVGSYVHVLENDIIYYIEDIAGTPTRCEAANSANYITSPADLATETSLQELLTRLGDNVETPTPYTVMWRLDSIKQCCEELNLLMSTTFGEVQENPTANTVLGRLRDIHQAVDGLELSVDTINLNTDGVELLLTDVKTAITDFNTAFNARDLATEAKQNEIITAISKLQSGGRLDYNNSADSPQVPYTNIDPYVGQWSLDRDYDGVIVSLTLDCNATLLFQFANLNLVDESIPPTTYTSQFPVNGFDVAPGIHEFHVAIKSLRWFRVVVVPDANETAEYFNLRTIFKPHSQPNAPVGQTITNDSDAIITKTVLTGNVADANLVLTDQFDNVGITQDGGLHVANPWVTIHEILPNGPLPSGVLPPFDPVGPIVAPNVIDTGWVNVTRFKDQFFQAQFDITGVKVFLMNGADDQGQNSATKSFLFPSAISFADAPIVSGAPFFQDYYRIVIINDSGFQSDLWSIRSQGSDTPPGSVYQSLDQPILPFFPAPISQNIIKGQTPSGTYDAVELDREGNLKVSVGGFVNPEARNSILTVPQTPFKTVPVETIQDLIRIRWDQDEIADVLDQTGTTQNATISREDTHVKFSTSTTTESKVEARTYDLVEYDPAHGVVIDYTEQIQADSTNPLSYYYMGQLDAQNGVATGRAPDAMNPNREFGILFRSRGQDIFIPQSEWNGDKCLGGAGSNFTKNGTPITLRNEFTKLMNGRIFSFVYGYLGYASITLFVKSPDGGYVIGHVIAYDGADTHLGNSTLPMGVEVYNGDGTDDIIIRSASWRGGIYKSREESRISTTNSFNENRPAGSIFTGVPVSTKGFDQIDVSIITDVPSAPQGMRFQGRTRGGTWYNLTPAFTHTGVVGAAALSDDGTKGVRTFQIPKGNAEFFRVKYEQGPSDGVVELTTTLEPRITLSTVHRIGDSMSSDRSATIVKAVTSSQQPDGDWVNAKSDGTAYEVSTSLNAGDEQTTPIIDTDGWRVIETVIVSDKPGLVYVTYYPDSTIPTSVLPPRVFEYGTTDALRGYRVLLLDTLMDGVSIKFVAGPVAIDTFYLGVNLRVNPSDVPQARLGSEISDEEDAVTVQGPILAKTDVNDPSSYVQIGADGNGSGLNVQVHKHTVETPIKALDSYSVGQGTVTSNQSTAIPAGRLSGRKTIEFSNHSTTVNVYYGPTSNVSVTSGKILRPGSDIAIEVDQYADFYWVAANTGGQQQTVLSSPSNASGTSTTPTNALNSDNAYALSAFGQNLLINGFSYNKTLPTINSILVAVEASKNNTPATQTTLVEESQGGQFETATATMSTAALAGGDDMLYLVSINRNALNGVALVEGGGLTFNPILTNQEVDGKRLDVWYAYGNATQGAVTASMTTSTTGVINCLRVSHVDPTTPILSSGVATGSGVSVTGPLLNKTALGEGVLIISHEDSNNTPAGGAIERYDQTVGTGSNNVSLAVNTKDFVASGSESLSSTLSAATNWIAVGVNLKPAPTPAIDYLVEVNAGSGYQQAGTLTFTSTGDTTKKIDISGVHPLTEIGVQNTTVRLTRTSAGDALGRIDMVYLEINEGDANTAARISYLEIGDSEFA